MRDRCGMFQFGLQCQKRIKKSRRACVGIFFCSNERKVARGESPNTKGEVSPRGRKGGIEEGLGIGM